MTETVGDCPTIEEIIEDLQSDPPPIGLVVFANFENRWFVTILGDVDPEFAIKQIQLMAVQCTEDDDVDPSRTLN